MALTENSLVDDRLNVAIPSRDARCALLLIVPLSAAK